MANRNFASGGKIYSMHVKPVMVNVNITIGASGAVTSFAGSMVASVVRTGTGLYKINMQAQSNLNTALNIIGSMRSPVSGLSGVTAVECQNAPTTSISNLAAPSIIVKTLAPAGTLVDPTSGSVISVLIMANDSSVRTS